MTADRPALRPGYRSLRGQTSKQLETSDISVSKINLVSVAVLCVTGSFRFFSAVSFENLFRFSFSCQFSNHSYFSFSYYFRFRVYYFDK